LWNALSLSATSSSSERISVRPQIELLEDRTVPSTLDLTTPGAVGEANGAIYEQANPQPTGVGVIHDFLRIQAHGKQTMEQGFNSDARPVQFDEKTDHNFTRSLQLSELPVVTVNGVPFRVFLLGVNQRNSQSLVSLDELRIYVADAPNLTGYDASTNQLAGLTPIYDLSANGPNWVKLDASLTHGNGSGDMYLFVPDSLFASSNPNPYVYLYSKFGVNEPVNGGFEQWAPGVGASAAPLLPALANLSGTVFQDNVGNGVLSPGDTGVAGVVLTLSGTNSQGQFVTLTTVTQADGSFIFANLLPGNYMITETPPSNFTVEQADVGTLNGLIDGSPLSATVIGNIGVAGGQTGINYNFALTNFFGQG
jgi:hypothetical protein